MYLWKSIDNGYLTRRLQKNPEPEIREKLKKIIMMGKFKGILTARESKYLIPQKSKTPIIIG